MQTILLAIDSGRSVYNDPRSKHWGTSWIDYALLGIFTIYTVELIIRVIVSGFILNPIEYSTINRQIGVRRAVVDKSKTLFALQRQPSLKRQDSTFGPQHPGIIHTFTTSQASGAPHGSSRQKSRARLAHRAFLRHSFNRLDFGAVVAFWISFGIGIAGVESTRHAYVFRMLSCLRILRLLGITSGTSVSLISSTNFAVQLLTFL